MIQNSKFKIQNSRSGLTLIELMVAIFIFSLIMVAILSVFVSTSTAHQKARAIKTVKENAEFAMSSIAKDVRMGNIDNATISNGTRDDSLEVKRNRGGLVCYEFLGDKRLSLCEKSCSSCGSGDWKDIVKLDNTNMKFDIDKAGLYSCPSTFGTPSSCPAGGTNSERRGWVEINLNIEMTTPGMEADEINVQTIVSSRDYGWEDI